MALLLYYNSQQQCHLLIIDLHSQMAVAVSIYGFTASPEPHLTLPPTILHTIFGHGQQLVPDRLGLGDEISLTQSIVQHRKYGFQVVDHSKQ